MTIVDQPVRLAAFEWLGNQVTLHGGILPFELLRAGFQLHGERVPLLGPSGIFKPRLCTLPLSIATTTKSPYNDSFLPNGLIAYSYRKQGGPDHLDNKGLRNAMARQVPLIYFHSVVKGQYQAFWPVYIVGDNREVFSVAVDDTSSLNENPGWNADGIEARREYITVLTRQRLHQEKFRANVLSAYKERCAVCRLRYPRLLDAAHIIEDRLPEGIPTVPNGISLCKLHHAAYDSEIVGISPDYVIQIREDIRNEKDGPVLEHGLKAMHGEPLLIPRNGDLRPDRDKLAVRFERFLRAA